MSNVILFPRAYARPASNACNHRVSPSLPMGNCEAGLSSGMSPDAAPGGTRAFLPSVASASLAQPPYFPGEVEVRMVDIEIVYMLIAGLLTVACLAVVLL
jgi:hypothetical protein